MSLAIAEVPRVACIPMHAMHIGAYISMQSMWVCCIQILLRRININWYSEIMADQAWGVVGFQKNNFFQEGITT